LAAEIGDEMEVDEELSAGEEDREGEGVEEDQEEDRVDEGDDYNPPRKTKPRKTKPRKTKRTGQRRGPITWDSNAPPPTFTDGADRGLVLLSTISSESNRRRLRDLILHLQSDTSSMSDYVGDSLDAVVGRVDMGERVGASFDLTRMADYMKFALHLDR
jgi:hypothetical protein